MTEPLAAFPAEPSRATTPPDLSSAVRIQRSTEPALWALVLDARRADPEARDAFARALEGVPGNDRCLVLATCHRVEVYGRDATTADAALATEPAAELLRGPDAARHLLRVATGLESAVVGEDQVLSQLRAATRALAAASSRDAVVDRLAQVALAAGRRVRRGGRPPEHDLAGRVLRLAAEGRVADGPASTLLVVGAGPMGTAVAMAASRRGIDVTIATRRPRRLLDAVPVVGLATAAELAPAMDAVVVALPAPWVDLTTTGVEPASLPTIVDLSSPTAILPEVRASLGDRFIGIDDLFVVPEDGSDAMGARAAEATDAETADAEATDAAARRTALTRYADRAEAEVERAEREFATWLAARPAAPSAERLVERARRRADRRVERTLRRMPDLDDRGRELVRQLAEQLAADLLHEPLARLRTDADGSARAAARDLFDL